MRIRQNSNILACQFRTALCWLAFFVLTVLPAKTQTNHTVVQSSISLKKYGPSDGLNYSNFKAVIKDSLQNLWVLGADRNLISTDKNLRIGSFDGVRFNSHALPDLDGFSTLAITYYPFLWENGKLLFTPFGLDGLFLYDIAKKEVKSLLRGTDLSSMFPGVLFDHKFYFIAKNKNGKYALAVLENESIRMLFESESLANSRAIYCNKKGVWVCRYDKIIFIDYTGKTIKEIKFDDETLTLYASAKTKRGIEIFSHFSAPFIIDENTGKISPFPYPELDIRGKISEIYQDTLGNALYVYAHPYKFQYAYLLAADGSLFDLSSLNMEIQDVKGIYSDNLLQSFWLATTSDLIQVQLNGTFVSHYLPNGALRKIQAFDDGNIYVQSENGGIFKSINSKQLNFKTIGNNVFGRYLEVTKKGELIANDGEKLYKTGNGSTETISLKHNSYDIVALNDSLLVSFNATFIQFVNKDTWTVKKTFDGIIFENPHKLLRINDETIFVAYEKGLSELNLFNFQKKEIFTERAVVSIAEDANNSWCFGTVNGGLYRYSKIDNRDKINKLAEVGTPIATITKDSKNKLWLGTFNGVYVYDTANKNLLKIDDNLLTHTECNRLSSFYDAKYNRMFIGTVKGLNVIDIDKINLSETTINLHLSYIHYFNEKTNLNDTLEFQGETNYAIQLDAYHRNLTVGFAPGISHEKNYQYYYSLVPADGQNPENIKWRSNGTNAELSLTNLASGHYQLLIKAKTDLTERESNHLVINVLVEDFFYNRWWFYVLLVAVLIGLFFWWQRRLRSENIRLENEVEKRTSELLKDKETIQKQAEELAKLDEMKTQFYNNISHELKTPLSLIIAPLEGLLDEENLSEKKRQEYLKLIARNANLLQERVEELLELTRLENRKIAVHHNPVKVADFVENNCHIFKKEAERNGIELNISLVEEYGYLIFDEKKVGKIIQNLIANAIKYCPTGSEVKVEIKSSEHQLSISVADDGPGIPTEHQPRIFEKFYQVPKPPPNLPQWGRGMTPPLSEGAGGRLGSGIGLSLVKEYVELMGGSVKLDSAEGEGTQFDISIPVSVAVISPKEEPAEIEFENLLTGLPTGKSANLLVVEDNNDLRHFLSLLLTERFNLTLAANGAEAIQLLENGLEVDVILSDIMMPKVDGMGLLNHVKASERFKKLPFIFLTAKQNEVTKLSALRLGVDDYLTKPFSEKELLLRIHRLLKNYEIRRATEAEIEAETTENPESEIIFTLQNFVKEKLTDPTFSVELMAEEFNMSARNLQRFMRKEVGMSPKEFIIEVQMNQLRELRAENQDLTLKELASSVGYTDHKYMSRLFYERFGFRL
ncbi:MAG: ATP-binding protein [Saprospiraceae bacterium]